MQSDIHYRERKLYHLEKLAGYIQRNREGIWYKEATEKGISIGAGSADKAGDILICRRMKLRGMRWSRIGADAEVSAYWYATRNGMISGASTKLHETISRTEILCLEQSSKVVIRAKSRGVKFNAPTTKWFSR